jgi:excinuclease UvrABC nuclease subunit
MKSYDFKKLPISSGIYQFADETGKILYVGKAKNLKNRIKSYFAKEIGRGPAIDAMVSLAVGIKTVETESEIEAILLEAELIKKLKPKYNIRLRDDKSFLVIKITKRKKNSKIIDEVFSKVELVRFKNVDFSDKSAEYFGPYPSGLLLKKSLFYLRKIFPFRDCSNTKYSTYRKKGRPCIYGDIRVCTAPCVEWVNEIEYFKNINYLKKFLRGKKQEVVKKLSVEMRELSKKKRFEEAGLVRDKLNALDHLKEVAIGLRDDYFNSGNALFPRIECYDISNIGAKYVVGSMIVFKDGKKSTDDYRRFRIKNYELRIKDSSTSDLSRLNEMLERRFKNDWPSPDLIVIDGGEAQLKIATLALKKNNLKIPVVSISKGKKRDKNEFHFSDEPIAKYVKNNLPLQNVLIQSRDEAHRFAIAYYRSLHKKGLFE